MRRGGTKGQEGGRNGSRKEEYEKEEEEEGDDTKRVAKAKKKLSNRDGSVPRVHKRAIKYTTRIQQGVCDLPYSVGLENMYQVNVIMQPTNSPTQGQPNPGKFGLKWHLIHFFPQQLFFRGLGLVLYGKQTTRNPTHPDYPQTP